MERREEQSSDERQEERVRVRVVPRDAGVREVVPPVQRREVFILTRDRVQ